MEDKDDIIGGAGQQNEPMPDILNDAEDSQLKVINLLKPQSEDVQPIQQSVQETPPPIQQNVQETPPPLQQSVQETPPPIQQSVQETPPPLQQNVQETPPPLQQNPQQMHNTVNHMPYGSSSFQNDSQPMQNAASQSDNEPRRPVYDKFMYEPIGFSGYNSRANIQPEGMYPPPPSFPVEQPDSKKGEKMAARLMGFILVVCLIMSIFGIIYDVAISKQRIGKIESKNGLVIYTEKKPENAEELENFVTEDGKYTTIGVSELVRPSIVEIYVYSDPAHKTLVGTGSGVVITDDGYIVTNAHVLQTNGYHVVETIDEETYSAKIIGRDAKTDIAVIKVNSNELKPATLGDSDEAKVGEQVIAIGNPANLSSTVTDGIISAINRKIRGDSTGFEMECIQTNADISPGNSGGALVNMYGQVIGITSSKYVSSSFEGLGFAISINEVKPIIEELVKNGFMSGRFKIGIQLLDMSTVAKREAIEETIKEELPEDFRGIYISAIAEDCDIANTELKSGDFITEIDGTPISTYDELYEAISSKYGAGDTVPAKCARLKKGKITYFDIKFKLMEDTSGDY